MNKNFLILKNVQIENANAISGICYGFPGLSHFLGFIHALSLKLKDIIPKNFTKVAIICHNYQVKQQFSETHKTNIFCLTRNPLNKDDSTPSFNEEGKMHLNISLIIECPFKLDDLPFDGGNKNDDILIFEKLIFNTIFNMKIAGGDIINIKNIEFFEAKGNNIEEYKVNLKNKMYKFLPGFFLVNRTRYLEEHHKKMCQTNKDQDILDSFLDFCILKKQSIEENINEKEASETASIKKIHWKNMAKPYSGFLVPLHIGYQSISKLLPEGSVKGARDYKTPFRYVESIYSIGEWKSPHKIDKLDNFNDVFWTYSFKNNTYLFTN